SEKLDEPLAERFLEFVRSRRDEIKQQRFRELLPVWLREFARQERVEERLRTDRLLPTPADVEADAVELVLTGATERETDWVRTFRNAAQDSGVRTTRALLVFEPPAGASALALPNYRRELFLEAQRKLRVGLELFECEEVC